MRIFIATPIYPPEVGGPALYAKSLFEGLKKNSHKVTVGVFNKSLPTGVRHLVYMFKSLKPVFGADVIISLDHFSVGFPIVLLSMIFGKNFYVRVGGDFLWEQWAERTRSETSLPDFYNGENKLSLKEKIIFSITRFVFWRSELVIFSTRWQRDIFLDPYKISPHKAVVIENYFPRKRKNLKDDQSGERYFLWAGREVFIKNIERLVRAFQIFYKKSDPNEYKLRIIGSGPLKKSLKKLVVDLGAESYISIKNKIPREEVREEMSSAHCVVIPSFSEVSPNTLADSLSFGIPFIVTKNLGWPSDIDAAGIFIDPFNIESIISAFEIMTDDNEYRSMKNKSAEYNRDRSWDTLVKDFESYLK